MRASNILVSLVLHRAVVGALPRLGPNVLTDRTRNRKVAQGASVSSVEFTSASVTFFSSLNTLGSKVDSCSTKKCVMGECFEGPVIQESVVLRSTQFVISRLLGGTGTPETE